MGRVCIYLYMHVDGGREASRVRQYHTKYHKAKSHTQKREDTGCWGCMPCPFVLLLACAAHPPPVDFSASTGLDTRACCCSDLDTSFCPLPPTNVSAAPI